MAVAGKLVLGIYRSCIFCCGSIRGASVIPNSQLSQTDRSHCKGIITNQEVRRLAGIAWGVGFVVVEFFVEESRDEDFLGKFEYVVGTIDRVPSFCREGVRLQNKKFRVCRAQNVRCISCECCYHSLRMYVMYHETLVVQRNHILYSSHQKNTTKLRRISPQYHPSSFPADSPGTLNLSELFSSDTAF